MLIATRDDPAFSRGCALANMSREMERETNRLRDLCCQIKEQCVQTYTWGRHSGDTLRRIEHLTACALDPAPVESAEKEKHETQ